MKIFLMAYELTKNTWQGMPRYAAELYDEFLNLGLNVEFVAKGVIKTPILHDNFFIPYQVLRKSGRDTIFHAITARQSIYTPIITRRCVVTIPDIIPLIEGKIGDSSKPSLASLYGIYVYKMAKKTPKIITISSLVKDELINILKVPEEKIEVVNFGINEQFRPISGNNFKKEKFRIGYIGGLVKRKRVDILIESFKILIDKHPELDVDLFIYGQKYFKNLANQYPELLKLRKKLGLKNVRFEGLVPYDKIVEAYNSFDVFVFPSKYEGFGMPIMEAQRCGVPVITMEDAKIPDEVSLKTIKCKDKDEVADKIFELLTNENYKKKVVKDALKYSQKFTWERCAKETIKVYEELL